MFKFRLNLKTSKFEKIMDSVLFDENLIDYTEISKLLLDINLLEQEIGISKKLKYKYHLPENRN